MANHTSEIRQERDAGDDGQTPGQSLQPEYAFVVQLRSGSAASPHHLEGRVEHVVSGEALRFSSTAELVEFLARAGSSSRRSSR